MKECDIEILGTLAWSLVNQAQSLFITLCQCIGNAILNTESHMVNTMVALVEPLLDCALRRCRLKQFELHLSTFQECGLHLLVGHFLYCITLQSQYILKVRERFFDTLDTNAQVLNVRNLHILMFYNVNTVSYIYWS